MRNSETVKIMKIAICSSMVFYKSEIESVKPIIINGNLSNIKEEITDNVCFSYKFQHF